MALPATTTTPAREMTSARRAAAPVRRSSARHPTSATSLAHATQRPVFVATRRQRTVLHAPAVLVRTDRVSRPTLALVTPDLTRPPTWGEPEEPPVWPAPGARAEPPEPQVRPARQTQVALQAEAVRREPRAQAAQRVRSTQQALAAQRMRRERPGATA